MSNPVLILGMHRSGTSCLAGGLECAGLHLGKVNVKAGFNKKGNREHEQIRSLHDEVLATHAYCWDTPPDHALNWSADQLDKLGRYTEDLIKHGFWGVKDPRSVFCLKGWRTRFKPRFVATYRHPLAVARSLMFRAEKWGQPMQEDDALRLWVHYNRQILTETEHTDTPFIRFDQAPEIYLQKLQEIAALFDLDTDKVTHFHSAELRNHDANSEPIPDTCRAIWHELTDRAGAYTA